jgi:glycosyltransferase involved in cell wall biosynthesis
VKGWVNEVVVVDSGSSDDTMAVARRAGARAISNPWPGFGEQKRFAEDHCTNDWLLNVDADEVVTPELCREIEALFASGSPPLVAYGMPVKRTRPLVHPFVRSSRRSFSRFAGTRLGSDRQPSVRETSGAAASFFNALV